MSFRNVTPANTKISVSGSSKAPKHILSTASDGEEHPWSTTTPASLHLTFPEPIVATHLSLTFQGGFVPTAALVWVARAEDQNEQGIGLGLMLGGKIFPEDKNKRQVFEIPIPPSGLSPTDENPSSGPNIVTEVPPQNGSGQIDGHSSSSSDPSSAGPKHNTQVTGAAPISDEEQPHLTELKIEFEKSSDQYGRITLYSLEVLRQ